jgi:hypothetical protein
VTPSPLAP